MWWKIYFGITIVEALLNILSLFTAPGIHIFTQIVLMLLFFVAVTGLYCYIFKKKIFTPVFWQYFLGIYVLIDIIYLIYAAAPHAPLLSSFSFLAIYETDAFSFINALIGVAIDIPLIIALYHLGQGKTYSLPVQKNKKNTSYKWGMLQTSLWGYSFVLTLFLFVLSFFTTGSANTKGQVDIYSLTFMTVLFTPLLLFWLWVVLQYKRYRWNWWRTTLVANALLYSGSIIFGILVSSAAQKDTGIDFISLIQLLVLVVSLYVFGREQFK